MVFDLSAGTILCDGKELIPNPRATEPCTLDPWTLDFYVFSRIFGAGDRTRTYDLLITNQFLVTFPAIR